jgi:hypothetical protein
LVRAGVHVVDELLSQDLEIVISIGSGEELVEPVNILKSERSNFLVDSIAGIVSLDKLFVLMGLLGLLSELSIRLNELITMNFLDRLVHLAESLRVHLGF